MININKLYKKSILTIILWGSLHVVCAHATDVLTLSEALLIAKQENVDIKINAHNLKLSALNNRTAHASALFPTFSYRLNQSVVYSFKDEDIHLISHPQITGTWSWSVGSITGSILSQKINNKNYLIEKLRQEKSIKETLKKVIKYYYEVALAQKQHEIATTSIHLATVRVQQNTEKLKIGLISSLDYIDSKLKLEQEKLNCLQLEKALKEKRQQLNLILNKPFNTETKVETTIPNKPICQFIKNHEKHSTNLDLKIQEKNIEIAVNELTKTKCNLLDFINLNFSCPLLLTTYDINKRTLTSTKNVEKIIADLSMNFNIAELLLIPINIRKQKIKLTKEKLRLSQQKTLLKSQIEQQRHQYNYAKAIYKVKEDHLKLCKQKLDLEKERYRMKQNTLLQVLEMEEQVKKEEFQLIGCAFKIRLEEFLLDELLGKF